MSQKIAGAIIAVAIAVGSLGAAGQTSAGNDGFIWLPFFCKDNPNDTQCKNKR